MRFFSTSKTFGCLLNDLGVAVSLATARLQPFASTISTGISVLGNTLNFTAKDLEILELDILPGIKKLNVLLEEQFETGKITTADYHGEFPWLSCLKRADILFRKRVPIFYATIDSALGCIGDALYLAANTREDSSSSKNRDFPYSIWAGICIGLQYVIHQFITQRLSSIHQEIITLRHELDLLKDSRDFWAWKIEVLECKFQEVHGKLEKVITERERLASSHLKNQELWQQTTTKLRLLAEDKENIENTLYNIAVLIRIKKRQNKPQSEIDSLMQKLESSKKTLMTIKANQTAIIQEISRLNHTMEEESKIIEKNKTEIAKLEALRKKMDERIVNLRNDLTHEGINTNLNGNLGYSH